MFDLKDAIRSLRRDLGYSLTVILLLAMTIGATTAVFSIVNGVLLRPLAYREAHRLVAIREFVPELSQIALSLPVNPRHFLEWRSRASTLESLAEFTVGSMNMIGAGDPAQVAVVQTTSSIFELLGGEAAYGRVLTDADDRPEGDAVVVLTDALWRRRFQGDPAVIGRTVTLRGRPHTVVGVMRPDFKLPYFAGLPGPVQRLRNVEAFVPLRIENLNQLAMMGNFNDNVLGRLKPGVDVERAAADLNVIQASIVASAGEKVSLVAQVIPLLDAEVGTARRGLLLLLAAVGAVLLIACSNLANLSLTRMLGRLRESALRAALGATRSRLVIRAIIEQLTLAVAGGVLGLAAAYGAVRAFAATAPFDLPRAAEVSIDFRVLGFAAAAALIAGLSVGLLPALRVGRRDVQQALRAGGLAVTDRGGLRARAVLLTLQVALSIVLLVVTALVGLSFSRLLRLDRGFDGRQLIAVDVTLPSGRYANATARTPAYDRVLAAVRALPGVARVSVTQALPMTGESQVDLVTVPGDTRSPLERPIMNYRWVDDGFFETLSIPLVQGRTFADADRGRATVPAIVSEQAAARIWNGRDPIGQRFSAGDSTIKEPYEVVGVVRDTRTLRVDAPVTPLVYTPYWQRNNPTMSLLIRTPATASALIGALRQTVKDVDGEIAIGRPTTIVAMVDAGLGNRRYQVGLLSTFGAIALLIAIVGVYGVTSYGVSRRRREMNIRVALGARASQVLALVLRQGMVPVLAGTIAGVVGAIATGNVVASLLFDVRPRDPWVITAVAIGIALVGLLASLVAARRGLTLNPALALRDE